MFDILIYILLFIFVVREYFLYHIFYRNQKGIDSSNRFNKMRLIWFVSTRNYLFADYYLDNYGVDIDKWSKIRLFFEVLHNEEKFADLFWWTENDEFENMNRTKRVGK